MKPALVTYQDIIARYTPDQRGIVAVDYRSRAGVDYTLKLKLTNGGIVCPACGDVVTELREHYRRAFAVCPKCARGERR